MIANNSETDSRYILTVVLDLLDSVILDPTAVVGVLHARLDLAVGEGTGEASKELLGLGVGSRLACRDNPCISILNLKDVLLFDPYVSLTVGLTVLLVLAGSEESSGTGGSLVGELRLVVGVGVHELVVVAGLVTVCLMAIISLCC